MELHVGEGVEYQGVVALRTAKAWVGKAEAPNAVAPAAVPASVAKAFEAARGKLVDDVAGTDDDLTERYLTEGDLTQEELDNGLRSAVASSKVVPIYFASGARPSGIAALLDGIVELVPAPTTRGEFQGIVPSTRPGVTPAAAGRAADGPAAGYVFKTSIDPHAGRTSYTRVLSGTLKPDSSYTNSVTGNSERLGKMYAVVGKDHKQLEEGVAGDIVAVAKLKSTQSGHRWPTTSTFAYTRTRCAVALLARGAVAGQGARRRWPPRCSPRRGPGPDRGNDERRASWSSRARCLH